MLLCLSQHTELQALEGSLHLPRYHRHIHRIVSVYSKLCCFVPGFSVLCEDEIEQCCRQTIYLPNPPTYDKRVTYFPVHIT